MEIKTNIAELKGPAPLYLTTPHEPESFPAYMQIDPVQRFVTFGVAPDARRQGGLTEREYYGQAVRIEVPNNLTVDRIKSLFSANLPRIQTIMAGYREIMDQYGNRIGRLSEQAANMLVELWAELKGMDASDGPYVYNSPIEYFDIFDYVYADTLDDALRQVAAEISADPKIVFADGADQEDILAALIAKRTEIRDAE